MEATFKKNKYDFFLIKMSWSKTKKKSGKNLRKSGKSQGISWDKKSGNPETGKAFICIILIFNFHKIFKICEQHLDL